jgi:hypothetical protein
MGALTGRAAFPSHGLRSRNRLVASVSVAEPPTPASDDQQASSVASMRLLQLARKRERFLDRSR